ncbi:MAG: plasma-membrane proton-efflux P-type ATPase [Pseudomonadota bacterium]
MVSSSIKNGKNKKNLPAEIDLQNGLTDQQAAAKLAKYGSNSLEEKKQSELKVFLSYFNGPIAWMIEAAALMALLVQDYVDVAIILGLLLFNALLGFWENHAATNALNALKKSLALKARVLRQGQWKNIQAKYLVPEDIIRLYIGDVVPADCVLMQGDYLSIDQSALTGESLPVTKQVKNEVYSGSIVKEGSMVAAVTATGNKTFFGRTAKLVASAGNISHFQKAVMHIGNFLIVLAIALAVVLIADRLFALGESINHAALLRLGELVLILLVASIPVAMPAVLSVTMALGAKMLARRKAIVSSLESIEDLAGIDVLCSDKTGTLTMNKLTLGEVKPWSNLDEQELVLLAALASRQADQDPIDLAILSGLQDKDLLKRYKQEKYVPFDPVRKRTEATITTADDKVFHVTKGAPQVIMGLTKLTDEELTTANKLVNDFAAIGYRTLAVARADVSGSWTFCGILPLFDPPRPDSKQTIARAFAYGIQVKMVTGDNLAIAKETCSKLGMGTKIQPATALFPGDVLKGEIPLDADKKIERADGFAQVFPEHKYAIVKELQKSKHIVGMTGDGVNDAPALKQADVGIAVSGATEAARAAAALVLTASGLSVIIDGIAEARRIFKRMASYVNYRIAMTINIMGFVVIASIYYGFFPLTALMLIALALLDDIPIMTIAYDNVTVDPQPIKWEMGHVLTISSILGLVAVVQSFVMLYIGNNVFNLQQPALQTMMFLQLVAGGHLLLFVVRTNRSLWKSPYPNSKLFTAIVGTQIIAIFMCGLGWLVQPLSWQIIGWVWLYNLIWMIIMDMIKLGIYQMRSLKFSKSVLNRN